jgi:hypothetical protein
MAFLRPTGRNLVLAPARSGGGFRRLAILAAVFSLAAGPGLAQSPAGASAAEICRSGQAAAGATCTPKAYERWEDNSPARAQDAARRYGPPGYFPGGYNRFYGFGR